MSTQSQIEQEMNDFREEWNKRWNKLRDRIDASLRDSDSAMAAGNAVEKLIAGPVESPDNDPPPSPVGTAWSILSGVQATINRGEVGEDGTEAAIEIGRGIAAMEILLRWDAARWRYYVEGGLQGVPMRYNEWMSFVHHNRQPHV